MAEPNGHPQTDSLTIPSPQQQPRPYSLATLGIHADDPINKSTDVAPALHVSTTFRYPSDPASLHPTHDEEASHDLRSPLDHPTTDAHIYSRVAAPNTSRLELILTQVLGTPCLTYTSGLSAFHAMIVWLHPRVVAIGNGYHGCHGVLAIYRKLTGCKVVDIFDESTWENKEEGWALGKGDVVHLETPVNPTGEAYDIQYYADLAHKRGAVLTVDATFAPPPLQDPFAHGADYVMHSGTKYFGGHSDMLCGVIAIGKRRDGWEKDYWGMFGERVFLGSVMGSLEGWLGVRSLRTLELRVTRQSQNCEKLVSFLSSCLSPFSASEKDSPQRADDQIAATIRSVMAKIAHASLQSPSKHPWLAKQMPNGFGPVFSFWCHSASQARRLPSKLHLFHHATSLGGAESLIEWRKMSDSTVEDTLIRVSVGVEAWEDLRADLVQGFGALAEDGR